MTLPQSATDPLWRIYITLARYPILRTRIRARMRQELFQRGVISPKDFEARVREEAIRSQYAEGLQDPYSEEPAEVWEVRLDRVRSHLTDFYFAYNLPFDLFEEIVREVLAERAPHPEEIEVSFNPELAPQNLLFEQAYHILQMPPERRAQHQARLHEIKVVLIRTLVSDQLNYVSLAKEWLTIEDLDQIRKRKIGPGKIGGKAAGMLLAYRILQTLAPEAIRARLRIPDSYYLGADVMYAFMVQNDLMKWADQKYKTEEEIRNEYPQLREEYLHGTFPQDILDRFRELLIEVGNRPLIVRSSSLLEDNFGTSFAGKYESHFLPNQGSLEENLRAFVRAIASVYASALAPDPLLYRRAKGLQDYDERIAILIQIVEGESHGRLFYPQAAGVAFSRNLLRWSPKIRPQDGFVRLVHGLGTRAVDRVGNDYPRLVALSHPLLRPEASPKAIRYYSQRYVDAIDLEDNLFRTLPLTEAVDRHHPALRYIFSLDEGGYLGALHTTFVPKNKVDQLVVTFEQWLQRTPFAERMRTMLRLLEQAYRTPVDMEFAARLVDPEANAPEVEITILQCRPQSTLKETPVQIPPGLAQEDLILVTHHTVPHGKVEGVRYVVFVTPEGYYDLDEPGQRARLVRTIGKVNAALAGTPFICVGPGRWGSSNPELGVQVGYADIYNARALVELAGSSIGPAPEPSFGTHFFQDLMEANIYPLAVDLDDPRSVFNRAFFYRTPSRLSQVLGGEVPEWLERALRVLAVEDFRPASTLTLAMDGNEQRAVAFVHTPAPQE